jgi:hypothetical protein
MVTVCVALYSSSGKVAQQATPSPPPGMVKGWRSRVDDGDEAEVKEDDEDEYHIPYLARQMSKLVHRGIHIP